MQGTDKGKFKIFEKRNRGRGVGIGIILFAVFLFLFLTATGANAYVCSDCHTPIHGECPNCTTADCHPNKLENINHLSGTGTPLDGDTSSAEGITDICKICHAGPTISHPFIINTDPDTIITGTTDLNYACGQCHGGGDNEIENPPQPGVPYYSKSSLAAVAEGMHASAGVSYPVTFNATVTSNTLGVKVNAIVDCGGACPGDLAYDWNWGDGNPNESGNPAAHTYATGGSKTISLTVSSVIAGGNVGSYTKSITLVNPNLAPSAAATCTFDADSWTLTVDDISTDDGPDADAANDIPPTLKIVVDWGDGSKKSKSTAGHPFEHTYNKAGIFSASLKAIDNKLQTDTVFCPDVTTSYFTIAGEVHKSSGADLSSASVKLLNSKNVVIKTALSKADGTFSFGSLKPGAYKVTVTKAGYTFPTTPKTVGPDQTGFNISALTP